jgi:hypothetical protein
MDSSSLLIATGELLLKPLTAGDAAADSESAADLALTLGASFWLVLLSALAIAAWRARLRIRAHVEVLARPATTAWIAATAQRFLRIATNRVPWRTIWGGAWRAQIAHMFVFMFLPLLYGMISLALFVMFLPFTAMGPGEKRAGLDGRFDHLQQPVCWFFVSWCPSPSADFRGLNAQETLQCARGSKCPESPIVTRDPWRGVWKLGWAVLAVVWIVIAIGRARRKKRPA